MTSEKIPLRRKDEKKCVAFYIRDEQGLHPPTITFTFCLVTTQKEQPGFQQHEHGQVSSG